MIRIPILPQMEIGTFDTFQAWHKLRDSYGHVLILETVLNAGDPRYRITEAVSHEEIASIPIGSSGDAKYLYHRFQALNPDFYDVTPRY